MNAFTMEVKKAQEAFNSIRDEAMREIDKMLQSGTMDSSIIDRIAEASDRVSEAMCRARIYETRTQAQAA